jgi:hypothetical protein
MSEYVRQTALEDAFLDMHLFKPKVEYLRISGSEYKIRLSYNNKSVILTEKMERGLTKEASTEYAGEVRGFPSMSLAETYAAGILRG